MTVPCLTQCGARSNGYFIDIKTACFENREIRIDNDIKSSFRLPKCHEDVDIINNIISQRQIPKLEGE